MLLHELLILADINPHKLHKGIKYLAQDKQTNEVYQYFDSPKLNFEGNLFNGDFSNGQIGGKLPSGTNNTKHYFNLKEIANDCNKPLTVNYYKYLWDKHHKSFTFPINLEYTSGLVIQFLSEKTGKVIKLPDITNWAIGQESDTFISCYDKVWTLYTPTKNETDDLGVCIAPYAPILNVEGGYSNIQYPIKMFHTGTGRVVTFTSLNEGTEEGQANSCDNWLSCDRSEWKVFEESDKKNPKYDPPLSIRELGNTLEKAKKVINQKQKVIDDLIIELDALKSDYNVFKDLMIGQL